MAINRQLFAIILCAAAPLVAATSSPDEALRQAFTRAMYSMKYSGHGIYRGENAAQRLGLEFDNHDVRLSHPHGSINFHLAGYGYGDRLQKPASAKFSVSGERIEYRRGDLTEWYVNGSQGLEQGFTVVRRPGVPNREGQPLEIGVGVSGELTPVEKANDSVLFESSRGVVLRYAGLKAWDAQGRNLASRLEVRGREIRLMVDDRDAQYPVTIDPTWTQQQELTASDAASGDSFGFSVAVSGNTAIIGAVNKEVGANQGQGAAYVFVQSGNVWTEQQELTASDGAYGDFFGVSVSLNGNTAVIGALGESPGSCCWGHSGSAYVFVNSSGVWIQQQKLTAGDGAGTDAFGESVSISGDTAVIGSPYKQVGSHYQQGAAYVFIRSGGVWTQQQVITENGAEYDYFGCSISVDGDVAVVGARGKNTLNVRKGAAYVFVRSGGVWTRQQELLASDGTPVARFGCSVSLSGNTVLIGSPGQAIGSNFVQGAAYVFVNRGGVWSQQQELTVTDGAEGDNFGKVVALSGFKAVIGSRKEFNVHTHDGAAYLFVRSDGAWTMHQQFTAPGSTSFGLSVSVDGDTSVIGSYEHASYSGSAAYVFVN